MHATVPTLHINTAHNVILIDRQPGQERSSSQPAKTSTDLTEIEIQDVEDDVQRELRRVEGEEPLGGKHVHFHADAVKVLMQV